VRREIGVEEMQISFLRDKQETYEAWIDQLHRLHHDEPHAGWDAIALRASERGRCRSFIDHLPRAGRSVAPPEPLGLEGIRKLLEPGRVLLEYFFGRERVYLFAVDHERLTFADLGPARDLADRIAFLAGDLRSRRPGTTADRQAAEELSARLLLEPLGGRLPNGPVTVAPDGPLFTLPFRILIETRGRDDVPVSYVPSATVLAWTRRPRRSSPSPSVLAVGVDDAGDRGIEVRPLALARREAAQAASFFPRAARRVLVGDVSETAVREALGEPFDVVHFATHAWVDAQDPGRGGLVLHASKDAAPGRDDDDGLLSAREIAEMDLGARVVILSGCATAGGELAPGEGVLGLGRSFLRAGAGSLLVTLWDVSDRAAFEITGRYEEAARGIPLDRALARTQRALGDLPDARAFVLVGDGRMTLNGLTPPPRRARALVASLLIAAGALLGILAWRRRQTAP
jgi:hypothetical protein